MKSIRKPVSILLAIIMVISLFPIVPLTAEAADVSVYVTYLDGAGMTQYVYAADYTVLSSDKTEWTEGTYVLGSDVEFTSRISVSGSVTLILCDGCTMDANNGIHVSEGNELLICAQSTGDIMGVLNASAPDNYAAIGGDYGLNASLEYGGSVGRIYIAGGKINARGGSSAAGIGCGAFGGSGSVDGSTIDRVMISGGDVTATGGISGAGIGGGEMSRPIDIYLCGGKVTATGGSSAAGIGGGSQSNSALIEITRGEIIAKGGDHAAGIGGGYGGSCNVLAIGGKITATGGTGGAGIGGGYFGSGGSIEILSSTVTAVGGNKAAGIGGGYNGSSGSINIDEGSLVTAVGGTGAPGIGSGVGGADGDIHIDYSEVHAYRGVGARLAGHTLSLDGDIGVNFYMELSSDIAQSETAYMLFTIPGGASSYEVQVPVSQAVVTGSCHVFKCNVAAKEMTSVIKAQIIEGGECGPEYTYSVKEYADYLLANADENGTDEQQAYFRAAPLVKAMLNYGTAAQVYFDNHADAPANASLSEQDKAVTEVTPETINKPYDSTGTDLPIDVTFEGSSLSLRSETTLILFLTSDRKLTFSCGDLSVDKTTKNGFQIAHIRGIKAKDIGNDFTLTVSAGADSGAVTFCPLTYCYNVLSVYDSEDYLSLVVKALYRYWEAAAAYFA